MIMTKIVGLQEIIHKFKYQERTRIPRHHTLRRLLNFILIRLQLLLHSSYILGYPYFVVIESTNLCNLACPLCPTGQGLNGRKKGMISLDNFKKIIDKLGPYLYFIRLENWGEPLLNDFIFEMIEYANRKKISTSLNTNLSFIDKQKAERLILCGLNHIKISLDGASAETYLKYRRQGDFKRVIENIKLLVNMRGSLKKAKPYIEIQFIVMQHNEHEIEAIKELSQSLGVDGLFIERLRPDMRQELFNTDAYSIEKFKDWLPRDSKYSLFDYSSKTRKDRQRICNYLWTSAVINWDGSIVPCCSVYEQQYDFGNFFVEGFRQVWNGPKYQMARILIGKRKFNSADDVVCRQCFGKGAIG